VNVEVRVEVEGVVINEICVSVEVGDATVNVDV
jgi:hypothetical protein